MFEPDFTSSYRYVTDNLDDWSRDIVATDLDAHLTYTDDIISEWRELDMPNPEQSTGDIIDDMISAIREQYLVETDWSDDIREAQLEYASHLLDMTNTVSWTTADTAYSPEELREELDDILSGTVDVEDAHDTLVEFTHVLNKLA